MYKELMTWEAEFIKVRHDLHRHPEVGFDVYRTSDIVASYLTEWGYEVHRGIGKTGLVAVLKLGDSPLTMGLRADMDALPMKDKSNLPYKSINQGVCHACGHDGHTTMLLAGARLLAKRRRFNGTLNLIFQPAEEGQGGAAAMINDGLFERFPCDYVFACHNMPNMGDKLFYSMSGAAFASSDRFRITIKGRGAHASQPQNAIDPIIVGSSLVMALQPIVSRNTNPNDSSVITIGGFVSGNDSSYNIIQDVAKLVVSVRTVDNNVRDMVVENIFRTTEHVCKAYGAEVDIEHFVISPALINDEKATAISNEAALKVFAEDMCAFKFERFMGSEDFAYMAQKCSASYVIFNNGKTANVHQPDFDFNDDLIIQGASYWASLVETYLEKD